MNRRRFLVSAAGTGLALVAGASAFALTRNPARALEPWEQAGRSQRDPRLFIVEHAVLAPNPHNRQPWIIELAGVDEMILWCDLDRRLPHTDPFDRQIVIGLGAFVELAVIAASALGFRLDVTPFPEGEPRPRLDKRPVARLRLVKGGATHDPLFAQIKLRRSTKQPFDRTRPVPANAVATLEAHASPDAVVGLITQPAMVERLRRLSFEAWMIESSTPRTYMESVDLMRIGKAEIEANPDGIALGGAFIESLALIGQVTREQLADTSSRGFQLGVDRYKAMLDAVNAYVTIISPGESRAHELAAGRSYVRANLAATELGLSMQPISQALQEFPEMAEKRKEVDATIGVASPSRLQILARIGYGPAVPPAPRWAAATRIRSA